MTDRKNPDEIVEDDRVLGINKVIRYMAENNGQFGGWGPRIRP